jgi:hypothetical protein
VYHDKPHRSYGARQQWDGFFWEDWQTFLPIPVSVIDINPEIAQNTGY